MKPTDNIDDDIKVIKEEDLTLIEASGQKDFVEKIRNNRKKAAKALKVFAKDLGNEAKETREASKILVKFLKEGSVSPDEEKELKTQVYDLFKMVGIGIPFFMIPGSTILLPFLIKVSARYGIDLLPTSFNHKDEEE